MPVSRGAVSEAALCESAQWAPGRLAVVQVNATARPRSLQQGWKTSVTDIVTGLLVVALLRGDSFQGPVQSPDCSRRWKRSSHLDRF